MKKLYIFLVLLILLLGLNACSFNNETITKTHFALDTYITITVYSKKDAKIIDEAFSLCDEYDALLSKTSKNGDIVKLENNRFNYMEVSEHTINIVNIYKRLYDISEKKLDCTIGSVSNLWNFKEITSTTPDSNDIQNALNSVNLDYLVADGNRLALISDTACLDFGAVAKGYISDCIKAYLIENGVKHAILNFGGNVLTIGPRPDGNNYIVGIQTPFEENEEIITSVSINDKAVITAGIYERYIESDNEIYHHILDPFTGYSADTDLISASIICDNAAIGDAYSTICILLGKDKALELINNTKDMEAIFIDNNKEIILSNGASKYINKE